MRFFLLLFVAAATLPVMAQPDDVPAGTVLSGGSVIEPAGHTVDLVERLQALDSLEGTFLQQLLDGAGRAVGESRGEFLLLQPADFLWHIREPDEQLLIASGDTLWHYDVELETATRRNIAAELSQSPLAVFSGDVTRVLGLYDVEVLAADSWRLLPRFPEAGFEFLEIDFQDALPVQMRIRDRAGQTTLIAFSDLRANADIDVQRFRFVPPDGVDVYYHER